MIAGNDIENGCASSLTETLSRLPSRAKQRTPGRVRQRGKGAVQRLIAILNHAV